MSNKLRNLFALATLAACGVLVAAQPARAQQSGGSDTERMRQTPSAEGGSRDIERDPFRACVAAHQSDPDVQQNCGWDGSYHPKH